MIVPYPQDSKLIVFKMVVIKQTRSTNLERVEI